MAETPIQNYNTPTDEHQYLGVHWTWSETATETHGISDCVLYVGDREIDRSHACADNYLFWLWFEWAFTFVFANGNINAGVVFGFIVLSTVLPSEYCDVCIRKYEHALQKSRLEALLPIVLQSRYSRAYYDCLIQSPQKWSVVNNTTWIVGVL